MIIVPSSFNQFIKGFIVSSRNSKTLYLPHEQPLGHIVIFEKSLLNSQFILGRISWNSFSSLLTSVLQNSLVSRQLARAFLIPSSWCQMPCPLLSKNLPTFIHWPEFGNGVSQKTSSTFFFSQRHKTTALIGQKIQKKTIFHKLEMEDPLQFWQFLTSGPKKRYKK